MSRFPVIEICSVALGTTDLERSLGFYTTVWGLSEVTRAEGVVYLRATGRDHHALSLQQHFASEVLSVTFRVAELSAIGQLCASVEAAGGSIVGSAHLNPEPGGGTIATVLTPEGYVLKLIHGDAFHADDTRSQGLPYRISHVNLNCKDIDATRSFFERALGFCLTDRSKMMAFLRCNDDHHAVVLADSGIDGMNHIAFMMPDTESVMRGSGRMVDHGYPIGWGVGRHGPGDNVFAYFLDPTGFVIEYTTEVLQVDDTYRVKGPDEWVWPPGRTDHWGIAPPKPDSLRRAQLAIPFASPAAGKSRNAL
jgi:catechol 2,3-dioxygenase-like lactoylglutathione lyase family enzyme